MKNKPIIRYDMPAAEYHADPALSSSRGRRLLKSTGWAALPVVPTEAMRDGTTVHASALEGVRLLDLVAVIPEDINKRTKVGRFEYAEWLADIGDREPVTLGRFDKLGMIVASVHDNPLAAEVIEASTPEVSIFWTEYAADGTPVRCKTRIDLVGGVESARLVTDLKTMNVQPTIREVERRAAYGGWRVQFAFNRRGLRAIGDDVSSFAVIAASTVEPYVAELYGIDSLQVEGADYLIDKAVERTAHPPEWHGYSAGQDGKAQFRSLTVPTWDLEQYEEG